MKNNKIAPLVLMLICIIGIGLAELTAQTTHITIRYTNSWNDNPFYVPANGSSVTTTTQPSTPYPTHISQDYKQLIAPTAKSSIRVRDRLHPRGNDTPEFRLEENDTKYRDSLKNEVVKQVMNGTFVPNTTPSW